MRVIFITFHMFKPLFPGFSFSSRPVRVVVRESQLNFTYVPICESWREPVALQGDCVETETQVKGGGATWGQPRRNTRGKDPRGIQAICICSY